MRIFRIIALMLLFIALASAGQVYGEIYKSSMERPNSTIIEIEGQFSYRMVSEKPNFSIYLPEGEYAISASAFDEKGNLQYYASEDVSIGDGDQRIDLVLKPADEGPLAMGLMAMVFIICASLAFFILRKKGHQPNAPATAIEPKAPRLDPDARALITALDNMEGRATQKELKESLKFSDSKLSLILTELEHYGLIRKFKKGRGNIIKKIS